MKKILSLILAMALTAALFTGCGCAANVSTHPGGMITEESTRPNIIPIPTATTTVILMSTTICITRVRNIPIAISAPALAAAVIPAVPIRLWKN